MLLRLIRAERGRRPLRMAGLRGGP
jgi:hypothetical protein